MENKEQILHLIGQLQERRARRPLWNQKMLFTEKERLRGLINNFKNMALSETVIKEEDMFDILTEVSESMEIYMKNKKEYVSFIQDIIKLRIDILELCFGKYRQGDNFDEFL